MDQLLLFTYYIDTNKLAYRNKNKKKTRSEQRPNK